MRRKRAAGTASGGFILLDAVVAMFVLTTGMLSAVYGISTFIKSARTLEKHVMEYTEEANARTNGWFAIPNEP